LERSPVLKRLDDQPVWSIVCLFIAKEYRGKGVANGLIHGALDYVQERGGEIIESYSTAPRGKRLPPISSFMGVPDLFERAGFVECARKSKARVVMRYSFAEDE
jgi:GNAT superfamily N-acetyltransferase